MNRRVVTALAGAFALCIGGAARAAAQHFPLEITSPKPVGPAPNGLDGNHRVYRAYPGLEYNIRVAVVGGTFPYRFALSGQPAGMIIDAGTGGISWPSPAASATINVSVTDSAGASSQTTWGVTVGTKGFVFVDAARGRDLAGTNGCTAACGTGTVENPWRTLEDVYKGATGSDIVYLRAGSYSLPPGIPRIAPGTIEEVVVFSEAKNPVIWLAYPGDARPVIDFAYTGKGEVPRIRLTGGTIYVDGLRTTRSRCMVFHLFQTRQRGSVVRRTAMDTHGPGQDGSNCSFIMIKQEYGTPAYGSIFQDNGFSGLKQGSGNSGIKLYSQFKPLVADNTFTQFEAGSEAIAVKSDITQFTVRGNRLDVGGIALGGNMAATMETTYGEFVFNNAKGDEYAMIVNQNGAAGRIFVSRNTLRGRILILNTDARDGPFTFSGNVIVNRDGGNSPKPFLTFESVSAPVQVVQKDNLTGAPDRGLVDAAGNLQGEALNLLGRRGHQLGSAAAK